MKQKKPTHSTKAFEEALGKSRPGKYILRLYIAGASEKSRRALERARHLCDVELQGRCELKVIDVYQQPILARDGQIIATPTLVKEFPQPVRRFIGTLENTARMFIGLDLETLGKVRP